MAARKGCFPARLRHRRRGLRFLWIIGTGMAVWAGFWIAITIANGWPAIYAIAAGVSLGMFALAAGASWAGRGREPEHLRELLAALDARE